jgi:hypothetical protein
MATTRGYLGVAAINNKLYAVGGMNDSTTFATLEEGTIDGAGGTGIISGRITNEAAPQTDE